MEFGGLAVVKELLAAGASVRIKIPVGREFLHSLFSVGFTVFSHAV